MCKSEINKMCDVCVDFLSLLTACRSQTLYAPHTVHCLLSSTKKKKKRKYTRWRKKRKITIEITNKLMIPNWIFIIALISIDIWYWIKHTTTDAQCIGFIYIIFFFFVLIFFREVTIALLRLIPMDGVRWYWTMWLIKCSNIIEQAWSELGFWFYFFFWLRRYLRMNLARTLLSEISFSDASNSNLFINHQTIFISIFRRIKS